jgi:hypothetical protein
MPSRCVSRHSNARHPVSINVPYTGSHGSASCHGVGDDRRAKNAATSACAPTARAARANSINAGPRHVSVDASRRRTRASWEFGSIGRMIMSPGSAAQPHLPGTWNQLDSGEGPRSLHQAVQRSGRFFHESAKRLESTPHCSRDPTLPKTSDKIQPTSRPTFIRGELEE